MESHVESKQPKKVVIKRQSFLKKVDVETVLSGLARLPHLGSEPIRRPADAISAPSTY